MLDIGTKIHTHDGNVTFERVQDCTPIAEYAQAMHNEGHVGSSEMRHAAKIPMVIVEKYLNDNNITFSEFMGNREHVRRMLNDPANSMFRIWKGQL